MKEYRLMVKLMSGERLEGAWVPLTDDEAIQRDEFLRKGSGLIDFQLSNYSFAYVPADRVDWMRVDSREAASGG